MLEFTWLFLFALAHAALTISIGLGFSARVHEMMVVIAAFVSLILFAIVAIASTNVQVVTDSGTVTQSQPAAGWYAYGMALISLIIAVAATMVWLPDSEDIMNNVSN
ncbi:hypothetical protein [Natranaeroarchaeum sulfidigenes]|uniref:Uncharacterized protein n=1 Tax=Natranaeroarchaeum sulfidigenes TaxID=2784880 RepID=A0A897MU90_9EURY|nr:hypothetical protein [Natranaeroarchaeum sulfidigenes]QSG02519.1 hypothetical protein AArcS_1302 [Natranaeroarchaeum sulfidigenes]